VKSGQLPVRPQSRARLWRPSGELNWATLAVEAQSSVWSRAVDAVQGGQFS
jgi:hypothetical protein